MSGYHTHMLIGAVGGLTAYKLVEFVSPKTVVIHLGNTTVPGILVELGCIGVSAYLALWPDIDEPGSFISRRAPHYMWLFGALLALIFGLAASQMFSLSVGWILGAVTVGTLIGGVGGSIFIALLRLISGGHRKLTHSMLLGMMLFFMSGVLFVIHLSPLALPCFALAWGQFLHLIGDVVTPGGVPLFYPLWRRDIHLFPHLFTRFGEPIIAVTALIVGFVFVWV